MGENEFGRKPAVRFPGLLRNDRESVERRRWYEEMENPIFERIHQRNEAYLSAVRSTSTQPSSSSSSSSSSFSTSTAGISTTKTASSVQEAPTSPRYLVRLTDTQRQRHNAIVCFPGAGAHPAMFARLARCLEERQDAVVFAVCLSGRMHRVNDPRTRSWKRLLCELRDELFAHDLSLPKDELSFADTEQETENATAAAVGEEQHSHNNISDDKNNATKYRRVVFVGHCLGALLAYELCRLFSFHQRCVSQIVVIAAHSPLRQSKRNHQEESSTAVLHSGTEKELLRWLLDMHAIPARLAERRDLVRKCVPTLRNDLFLLETYHVQEPHLVGQAAPEAADVADETESDRLPAQEIESLLDMPPSLFKISLPIVSIHAEGDAFLSPEDVETWKLASSVDHVHHRIGCVGHYFLHEEPLVALVENILAHALRRTSSSDESDDAS